MTTRNLNIPDDLEAKLTKLGHDAIHRPADLDKADNAARAQQDKIMLGASVLFQRKQDEIAERDEERRQLDEINSRQQALLAAARGTAPSPAPQPTPQPEPVAPQPQPQPTQVDPQPASDDNSNSSTRTQVLSIVNVREWTGKQWLYAILGAIIGILVNLLILPLIPTDNFDNVENFLWGLLRFLLVLALFFTGGFIGAKQDEQQS